MNIYREYDIRGIYEKELNEERVVKIGYVLASKFWGEYVAVGFDARGHSPVLFEYLVQGLNAGGKKVLNMGLVPTPVNYFSNYELFDGKKVSASVMITGSHNPPEYNGFKITIEKKPFFGEDIYQLGRECEALKTLPESKERFVERINAKERYISYISEAFSHLRGMHEKIVYDCGNGAAGVVTEEIFTNLQLNTKGIYTHPDGTFPNHHPDPSKEENLKDIKKLLEKEGDIAFAYDGDGDRVVPITHTSVLKGDMMALLYTMQMQRPTVIADVKCSQMMFDELEDRGCKTVMYKTGHSNIKTKLKELNAEFACEVNGHIFFNDRYFGYDDAIYATLRMLELIKKGVDIDYEIEKLPRVYATEEIDIKSSDEEKFLLVDKIAQRLRKPGENFPKIEKIIEIDGLRVVFENGWGLIRASNTTPLITTRFEASSEDFLELYQEALNGVIQEAQKN